MLPPSRKHSENLRKTFFTFSSSCPESPSWVRQVVFSWHSDIFCYIFWRPARVFKAVDIWNFKQIPRLAPSDRISLYQSLCCYLIHWHYIIFVHGNFGMALRKWPQTCSSCSYKLSFNYQFYPQFTHVRSEQYHTRKLLAFHMAVDQ